MNWRSRWSMKFNIFYPTAHILTTKEQSNRNNMSTPFSRNNSLTDS